MNGSGFSKGGVDAHCVVKPSHRYKNQYIQR